VVPKNVKVTSNSFLEWRSQFVTVGAPLSLDIPEQMEMSALVDGMYFYGHAFRSHVEARRFAINTQASISLKSGQEVKTKIRFINRATLQQSSIGFAAAVDGLKVSVPKTHDLITASDSNSEKIRAFRTSYFRHCVLTDTELKKYANTFQLEWLCQAYSSTLCAWSVAESTTLEVANGALIAGTVERAVAKVLDVIFETLNAEDPSEESGDEATGSQGKLREEVISLFGNDFVLARLKELAQALWSAPDTDWLSWARDRYLATLGGAIVEACAQLYPEASADDLLVDIDPGASPIGAPAPSETHDEVWITEMTLGGAGVLEEVARRQAEDPRRFFRLIESALGPSDYELVDVELTRILEMIPTDAPLRDLLDHVRAAERHTDLQHAVSMLEAGLAERGVSVTHPVMSAVYARILRPGSGPHTDGLLLSLILRWRAEECRLGMELDARVFAYLASNYAEVIESLKQVDPMVSEARASRFHAIYALLWPRGNTVRSIALSTYNPFTSLPPTDRELVLDRLTRSCPAVEVTEKGWRDTATIQLRKHGSVYLNASHSSAAVLKDALLSFGSEPMEIDALLLFTRVEGIERGPTGYRARIYLDEAIQ
jgi:hypothetical protein